MGFLWEGSTGARALRLLQALPQGQGLRTPDLAQQLGVAPYVQDLFNGGALLIAIVVSAAATRRFTRKA